MSLRTRISHNPRFARLAFNVWPCIRGTGARVEHIAPDWSELRVRLPLSWRTRNYVGTIFGGSIYGAVDPYYMLMLLERLGPGYVVWDKAATVRFRRPGTRTLRATFHLTDDEVAEIRAAVDAAGGTLDRTWTVELVDPDGEVCASVEKVIYVATKDADRARRAAKRA
jgi:acyl-coenzyme A thioesterase PaaI-like protein